MYKNLDSKFSSFQHEMPKIIVRFISVVIYACILKAHNHTQRVEVQSELPLNVNAAFE